MSNSVQNKNSVEVLEPATLADMVDLDIPITAHCRRCGHWARLVPDSLGLPLDRSIPSLEGVFTCSVCQSRDTCAMPEYRKPVPGGA